MKWSLIEPSSGDIVRVKLGAIYHYGIYVSDNEIIQFGLPPTQRERLLAKDIVVCSSNIDEFLVGGFLEVGVLDSKEKSRAKNPKQVVDFARKMIGTGGYHILYNNCEHFANQCVFGVKKCSQLDDVRNHMTQLKLADVYVAEIPAEYNIEPNNDERKNEILAISNKTVATQKRFAWAVLEYALKKSFNIYAQDLNLQKNENGKIVCDMAEVSISHTDNLVAVAVAKAPVGVDVEKRLISKEGVLNKILTNEEKNHFENVTNKDVLLSYIWTRKEAIFKRLNKKSFLPFEINSLKEKALSYTFKVGNIEYVMSISGVLLEEVNCYSLKLDKGNFKCSKKSIKKLKEI